ncbi:hypothetical protein Tco_1217373 [Tanacetum coccineum]
MLDNLSVLDNFRTIFQLPQATGNNHDHFVTAPRFSKMVSFYINNHGFTLELRSKSNFKTTGLLQPWQTLRKMFSRCLRPTRVTDDLVLQETLQVSLAERHEDFEAKQNVEKVKDHLMAEEIEKLVKGSKNVEENVEVASSPLRNDDNQTNPNTRLEPRSDKESPEVEKIVDISQHVNVNEEEEESAKDDYELRRREKGKHVEEIRNTPSPTTIKSPRISTNLVSSDTEKLQELTKTDTIPSSSTPSSSSSKLSATNRLLTLFKSGRFKDTRVSLMSYKENISLPKMVDECIKKILQTQVPLHVAKGTILEREKSQAEVAKMIVRAIPVRNVDSSVRSYMSGHVLHVHPTQATLTNA